jgi:hypothetical protein
MSKPATPTLVQRGFTLMDEYGGFVAVIVMLGAVFAFLITK